MFHFAMEEYSLLQGTTSREIVIVLPSFRELN